VCLEEKVGRFVVLCGVVWLLGGIYFLLFKGDVVLVMGGEKERKD
jgi:hypothetical protein